MEDKSPHHHLRSVFGPGEEDGSLLGALLEGFWRFYARDFPTRFFFKIRDFEGLGMRMGGR